MPLVCIGLFFLSLFAVCCFLPKPRSVRWMIVGLWERRESRKDDGVVGSKWRDDLREAGWLLFMWSIMPPSLLLVSLSVANFSFGRIDFIYWDILALGLIGTGASLVTISFEEPQTIEEVVGIINEQLRE